MCYCDWFEIVFNCRVDRLASSNVHAKRKDTERDFLFCLLVKEEKGLPVTHFSSRGEQKCADSRDCTLTLVGGFG